MHRHLRYCFFFFAYSQLCRSVRGKRTSNRWLQNLSAKNTSLLIFLNSAWMFPCAQIVSLLEGTLSNEERHFSLISCSCCSGNLSKKHEATENCPYAKVSGDCFVAACWRRELSRCGYAIWCRKSTCIKITREFCHTVTKISSHLPWNNKNDSIISRRVQNSPSSRGNGWNSLWNSALENPFDYFDRQHRYIVIMEAAVRENWRWGIPSSTMVVKAMC